MLFRSRQRGPHKGPGNKTCYCPPSKDFLHVCGAARRAAITCHGPYGQPCGRFGARHGPRGAGASHPMAGRDASLRRTCLLIFQGGTRTFFAPVLSDTFHPGFRRRPADSTSSRPSMGSSSLLNERAANSAPAFNSKILVLRTIQCTKTYLEHLVNTFAIRIRPAVQAELAAASAAEQHRPALYTHHSPSAPAHSFC